jgi:twitching motility protein PilT
MAKLEKVFRAAVANQASDVHVVTGEPIIFRRVGRLVKLKSPWLSHEQASAMIFELLSKAQREQLQADLQLDFVVELPELGRFRGSAVMHQHGISAIFRVIPPEIPQLDTLGLPEVVHRILENHQGLILVTGATGDGKSTTLAAMVDLLNASRAHHILTVEDPIEFVHPVKKGVVNQRQVGRDTHSYSNALRGALREDPDVIMVGELRDLETISLAITAAETGHLVLGTLSTSGAAKTVDRIIDSFPAKEQRQVRTMLSESLRAVLTQRLIPRQDNKSMALAAEVLIGSLSLSNLIKDGKTFQIHSIMQTGRASGMQLMDDSILNLYQAGTISRNEAARQLSNPQLLETSAA